MGVKMFNYITATMVGIFQIILSISLICRKKNKIAIVSELISSLALLFVLNDFSFVLKNMFFLQIVFVEYLFVKIFLVFFMLVARYYCFYKIRKICREKKKIEIKERKFIHLIRNVEYWPKLKLGIPSKANKVDKKTNIKFDSRGFPIFKSYYTVKLKRKDLKEGRERHFYIANTTLYKDKSPKSRIKAKLRRKQVKQLSQGCTPEGYTWHHHQDTGVLQLVDEKIHAKTWHYGGYSIWGGK